MIKFSTATHRGAAASGLPVILVFSIICVLIVSAIFYLPKSFAAMAESPKQADGATAIADDSPPAAVAVAAADKDKGDFVVFLSGNWGGKLEPCGCFEKQFGGIDRRGQILDSVPADRRLLIDAGSVITDDSRQSQLKLETFLYSFGRLGYDVIVLSSQEAAILRDGHLAIEQNLYPPLLATDAKPDLFDGQIKAVRSFAKTLRSGDKNLDSLVLGLPVTEGQSSGDLKETVEAITVELKKRSVAIDEPSDDRLIIVTLQVDDSGLIERLCGIAAIDVIVKLGYSDEPELWAPGGAGPIEATATATSKNRPIIVTTGCLGKYVSRLDVSADSSGTHETFEFSRIAVEEQLERDERILELFEVYQSRLEVENLIEDTDQLPREPLFGGGRFVGNSACGGSADCHPDIYQKWRNFRHGHAIQTLLDHNRQYDPECMNCHVVGLRYEGGYRSMDETAELADVGCEMCHGPGSEHLEDPYSTYQQQFTACESCHDHEASPFFERDRRKYFEKIRHWDEPRKYWQ